MRSICLSVIAFALLATAYCQNKTPQEEAVYQVVQSLFDGMRAGDSAVVHAAFYRNPELFTAVNDKEGRPVLHKSELQEFLNAVGAPHDVVWDERIWDEEIRIDGNLAQVWTKYAFFAGNEFSHCGVDAFHLFKTKEGWKIFHLTDTRQREGCNLPEHIQKKP